MKVPTIHLNGSSPQVLLRQYHDAISALNTAIEKLRAIEVHGRDYYPQGPTALGDALDEHRARVTAVCNVQNDLLHIAEYILDAIESRAKR